MKSSTKLISKFVILDLIIILLTSLIYIYCYSPSPIKSNKTFCVLNYASTDFDVKIISIDKTILTETLTAYSDYIFSCNSGDKIQQLKIKYSTDSQKDIEYILIDSNAVNTYFIINTKENNVYIEPIKN